MRRSRLGLSLAATLAVSSACRSYVAVLSVEVTTDADLGLSPGVGGYRVTVADPEGVAVTGLSQPFFAFVAGPQTFVLEFEQETIFAGAESRALRLIVEALAAADGSVEGKGSAVVTVEKDAITSVAVVVRRDPRPVSLDLLGDFLSEGSSVDTRKLRLTWPSLSLPADYVLHAWSKRGTAAQAYLGVVDTAPGIAEWVFADPSAFADTTLSLSIEPTGQDPRTFSDGWHIASGATAPGVRVALTTVLGVAGDLAAIDALLDAAIPHAGFAQSAVGTGATAEVLIHCEHVFLTTQGDANPSAGDFNGDGSFDFLTSDHAGVAAHLTPIRTAATSLGEPVAPLDDINREPIALSLFACANNVTTALTDLAAAATTLAADPTNATKGAALVAAANLVRGSAFDGSGSLGNGQTAACVANRLEAMTAFHLTPTAKGSVP